MAMASATLATGLANMAATDSEATAIDNFANAWGTYFNGAMLVAVPFSGDPASVAKNAMKAAMVGLSTDGATKIQAGIVAYWGQIVAVPAAFFTNAKKATLPPLTAGIAAALAPIFAANTAGNLSLVDSTNAIATCLHTNNLGGLAKVGPGPDMPIL